jgi:3-oxoacyl-[acyl-carrier protein] reductase
MDTGLKGRVALITGATRNHGRACALAFAKEGADLLLCTKKSMDQLKETAHMASEFGVRVATRRCDVTDAGQVDASIKAGVDALGPIDIVVHCAGWRVRDRLTEMRKEAWEAALGVNVHALFHLCKAVLPEMSHRRWGRILAYSAGLGPFGGTNAFGISWQPPLKMACVGFIRAIAREYGKYNITANCVGPGNIDVERTPGQARQPLTDGDREVPLLRKGTAQECAAAAVFLASELGGYITGQNYLVNGGGHFL